MDPMARLLHLAAAARLPGIEQGTSYGTPSLKLRGKFLARLKDAETLVIRCPLEEKERLLAAEPQFYFQTDHYIGWPAILIRLPAIDDARLTARLESAWRLHASKKAITARQAPSSGLSGGDGETMAKAEGMNAPYSFFEHDGAYFRRKNGGNYRSVDDILRGGKWHPYKGSDPLKPALYGDEVDDPTANGGSDRGRAT